jgi:hypothetical protein
MAPASGDDEMSNPLTDPAAPNAAAAPQKPTFTLAEFLETKPPHSHAVVSQGIQLKAYGSARLPSPLLPQLKLHCIHKHCEGARFFRPESENGPVLIDNEWKEFFVSYTCSNCQETVKRFALAVRKNEKPAYIEIYKIGEMPAFGPPTPNRLLKLIGDDRELFLHGRRCETQGMGIGAFGYYRRVVENQKNRILKRIIKACGAIGVPQSMTDTLTAALNENQFSKAVESIKDALPESLLIRTHNPMTLLHSALSDGLHARTDDECMAKAQAIRIILTELSERLANLLKDETEIKAALSQLMQRDDDKKAPKGR